MQLKHVLQQPLDDCLIITVNQRLSARVKQVYAKQQTQKKLNTWHNINVLALNDWLSRSWQNDLLNNPSKQAQQLLSSQQSLYLWQAIINEDAETVTVLDSIKTAQLAQQAWEMLQHWQVPLLELEKYHSLDSQLFLRWANCYQQRLSEKNCLDSTRLLSYLTQTYQAKGIEAPKKIKLLGFNDVSPLIQALFASLHSEIEYLQTKAEIQTQYQITFSDPETEMLHMARWAKAQEKSNLIACVVPDLQQQRRTIHRIFQQVFSKPNTVNLATEVEQTFSLSGGESLYQYPLIQTALNSLQLNHRPVDVAQLQQLLCSPFLSDAETALTAREFFIAQCYDNGYNELYINQLIPLLKTAQLPELAQRFICFQKKHTKKQTLYPHQWAEIFSQQLDDLAWPGQRDLNSEEYQLSTAWQELLINFSKLDPVLETISFSQAIETLTQLCKNTLFQAKSPDSNVHILGLLEAADLEFDAIWIMGLDDNTWPSLAKPNPLIPYELQRKLQLPHASQQREFDYCQQLTQRFKQQTPLLLCSYSNKDKDQTLRPSPLIKTFKSISAQDLSLADYSSPASVFEQPPLETFIDTQGPSLDTNKTSRGGSGIFRLQSNCPFQAFAKLRLSAENVSITDFGLDPMQRGILMHHILEKIWQKLNNQKNLLSYDTKALDALIEQFVTASLDKFRQDFTELSADNFYEIEQQRLIQLVRLWLDQEKQRPEFSVVAIEEQQDLQVSGIQCQVKIDRIDQVEDGSYYIIDYKTGKASPNKWFGDRIEEPQLPLYLSNDPRDITGLLFASLHPEEMQYRGVTQDDATILGVKTINKVRHESCKSDWQQQKKVWQECLETIANDFIKGDAQVDPLKAETCQYCDLMTLCRIHEQGK